MRTAGRRLSTPGLYDLFATRGQAVDKKTTFRNWKTYPQLHPHPQGPFYRGFQWCNSLLFQQYSLLFNQIWLYHHHIASDLYTDLKLGTGSWVTISVVDDGNVGEGAREEQPRRAWLYGCSISAGSETSRKLLHVEHTKRNPALGRVSDQAWFHVEPGMTQVRDAAASPRDATSRCWLHAPGPRNSNRGAG